ncbi:MAG: hypothetical protein E7372_03645 [Clostridiales bacterium]|nr:hypothetical protein [Clostridiales bacterium]
MLKYLIIGDANSMHIYNFIKNVLSDGKFEVSVMTLSTKRVREEYRTFYKENNVRLYSIAEKYGKGKDLENRTIIQRLKNFIRKYIMAKSLPKFDICNIQSVYKTSLLFYLKNKRKFKHLITSYWGGDIEDTTPIVMKLRKRSFDKADAITVTTQKVFEDFKTIYGDIYNDKLKICRFATAGIECVKQVFEKEGIEGSKKIMNFPLEKLCITVGYSAYEDQHQDLIIDKIATLPQEIKDKLFISVPMQYGACSKEFRDLVKEKAKNSGCESVILEEYAPFEMKAAEAIATDLYFNMRDTDAFSNSLKEQVCAGSSVVIGSWLKYYELEQMNANFVYVDSFDKIPEIVLSNLENKKEKQFFRPIYDMYSFEAVKKQWDHIFDKVLKERTN